MNERVLSAFRLRAVDTDHPALAQQLLQIVASSTASTSVTLRHAFCSEEVRVGSESLGGEARLEHVFSHGSGTSVVCLERASASPFDAGDADALELLGGEVILRLDHARATAAASRSQRQVELLRALSRAGQEVRPALTTAARELSRITRAPRVHIFLVDAAKTTLTGVACANDQTSDLTMPMTSSMAITHAFQTLEPVVIEHAGSDPRANKSLVAQVGTQSLMVVPLVYRGEAIGAIVLVETVNPRKFTETEVALVVAVANLVSAAIANAKMFDDLRESYTALARTQAELVSHERLAALGELSAVIAHEVRNPVAIIFNSLGAIRRLDPPTAEVGVLDIVEEETARLNRIVGDLLDFVRPYAAHPRHVQIDAVVRGAVLAARRSGTDTGIELRTELLLPCNDLYLDETMFQQALLNLIVNAMQAAPKGTTVIVRARTSSDAKDLCCDVIDEGPGIDAAQSDRVFQPFFTTKATGTGLGLALVRRLSDALGGAVAVTNGTPGGCTFTLTVPFVSAQST